VASPFPGIASAVKTVLDGISNMPTTVVRKRDVVLARDAPPGSPLCVISYAGEGAEDWATTGNGSTDLGTIGTAYGIWISIYRDNRADVASSATNPDLLAAIQALNKGSLSGAGTVWNTELQPHEEWEEGDFGKANERSRFRMLFQAAELRNG
jgi:hypothetical protein